MNLEYFRDQMCDELRGAKCYAKHAIEVKAMSREFGDTMLAMSAAELKHASNLYAMAQEYYEKVTSSFDEPPKYLKDIIHYMTDEYTEKSAKVKYIHEMYNK